MSIAPALLKAYPALNDAQRDIVGHDQGPLLVIAGPGSGKTFSLSSSRFGYKCLNSWEKVLLFPRFEIGSIEFLEIRGPIHGWGKRIATLPPNLKTTEERRSHLPLIRSLHTQLPQIPMSFQDHQTMKSTAEPLDKST